MVCIGQWVAERLPETNRTGTFIQLRRVTRIVLEHLSDPLYSFTV